MTCIPQKILSEVSVQKKQKKKSLRLFIIFLLHTKMNSNLKLRLPKGLLFWHTILVCFLHLTKFTCKSTLLATVNGELESESILHIYHQEIGRSACDHTVYCLLWTPHQKGRDSLILFCNSALVVSFCLNITKWMYCMHKCIIHCSKTKDGLFLMHRCIRSNSTNFLILLPYK